MAQNIISLTGPCSSQQIFVEIGHKRRGGKFNLKSETIFIEGNRLSILKSTNDSGRESTKVKFILSKDPRFKMLQRIWRHSKSLWVKRRRWRDNRWFYPTRTTWTLVIAVCLICRCNRQFILHLSWGGRCQWFRRWFGIVIHPPVYLRNKAIIEQRPSWLSFASWHRGWRS